MFKKVLGTIKNYFSPKLMLSNEEYAELYLDKHKKQINGVIISNVICIFLILFLVISDFENISKEKGDTIYLYYYKVIVLATIVLSIIIATVAIWMRKTNNYPTVLVKFILYSSIFIYTTFNLFATILGRGLQGAELVGIHLAISLFATIYYLNRFERLVYLTLASIAFYFSIKGLIKNPFIFEDTIKNFITACVLFYIIGDFIYTLWIGNIEKYFSNIKKIDQLNEKNKQQENTFKALSLALSQYDNDSSKALAEKAIHLNIEERTHLLLEEFSNTQNLFKTTFQKYQDIFSNVNDGILILDKKGVVIDANKAGLEILEIKQDDIGKIGLKDLVYDGDIEKSAIYLKKLLEEGAYSGYEGRIRTSAGAIKYLEVSSTAIYNKGEFAGSRDIIRDISIRKKAEDLIEKARQAERQFLANMSHEIRTPLNAIIGMAHLLYDTRPTKEQVEYLDILKNSANFLHLLISDILDMAKLEAGKMEINAKEFDLHSLLKTIQHTFQLKVENKPIEIITLVDPRLDGYLIGDDLILNQILYNLLGNAEKFTEKGEITLTVRLFARENDLYTVEFKISDTGRGIEKEKLGFIFEKFTQIHDKEEQKQRGTGLGLALCKEFIEMQNGEISVESELGKGTTFTFLLSFVKVMNKIADQSNTTTQSSDTATSTSSSVDDFVKYKILVAEDNPMNRKYISTLLTKWGVVFDVANDGKEAVEFANTNKYDMILMDIQMPKLDGYEATISIRNSNSINKTTSIIALTASAMLDQKEKALSLGMNDFLSKPFTPSQLQEIILKNKNVINASTPVVPMGAVVENKEYKFSPAIDATYMQEIYGDDYAYLLELFVMFEKETLLGMLDAKDEIIASQDADKIYKWLHKYKPSFTMVGLPIYTQKTQECENYFRMGTLPIDQATVKFKLLLLDIENLLPIIRTEIENLSYYISQNKINSK